MNVFELIQNPFFFVFILFLVVALLYAFRSYISVLLVSLFFDYGVDAGLSFADNFLAGAGLTGVDIGDLVAAFILFTKYRSQVGWKWALLFALEAANFGLSIIPWVGEGIELFFSAVPIVSIIIFWKQYKANQIYYPIKEYAAYLRDENVEKVHTLEENISDFEKEYNHGNYEKIEEDGCVLKDDLFAEVRQYIMEKLSRAQQYIITTLQKEVQIGTGKILQQDINTLTGAIQKATRDIETDWRMADKEANQILQTVSSIMYRVGKEETDTDQFKQAA